MRSIKAITAGTVLIVIAILLMQLAYIFIAVGYNALAKDYPLLNDITGWLRYLVAFPVFLTIMFIGGFITAEIARVKIVVHCVIVALITAGGTTWWATEGGNLTLTGVVILILAIAVTVMGGMYWQKGGQED
ncbi:MAG: hypothetical protein OEZ15_09195 [Gammaproteobacteria bacterium]|nr:hypothetical protein [Gammaproteobacteria bacterium]